MPRINRCLFMSGVLVTIMPRSVRAAGVVTGRRSPGRTRRRARDFRYERDDEQEYELDR